MPEGTIHIHTLKSLPDVSRMSAYGKRTAPPPTFGWNFSHSSSSGPSSVITSLPFAVFQTWIIPFMSPVAQYSPLALYATAHTLSYA